LTLKRTTEFSPDKITTKKIDRVDKITTPKLELRQKI
jgi:hypothetical protein